MRFQLGLLTGIWMAWSVVGAESWIGAGRGADEGLHVEAYGGVGRVERLSGELRETREGGPLEGGVRADLEDLNLDDGVETGLWGGRVSNRWLTFLVDFRHSRLDASGTADREYRLNVEGLAYAGLDLEYLIIPVNAEYDIEAETTWLGAGVRVTPFTLFPEGRVRFTPWAHLGAQWIRADYDVDAGATANLEVEPFTGRVYARRGRAEGEAEAVIPEYGLGGEVRVRLGGRGAKGPELVGEATWKLLDFQGAVDSLGVDDEEFEDLDLDYTALEANLYLLWPLNERVDLLGGVYMEQVDATYVLESDGGAGGYDREIDLSYTLYGIRAGVRF